MLSKDYILGFVEGEGCFSISISKYIDRKPRKDPLRRNTVKNPALFRVKPFFVVTNIESNKPLLEKMREQFGVGNVYITNRAAFGGCQNIAQYRVQGVKDCLKVRGFFNQLVFETQKGEDFRLWSECLGIMETEVHLNKESILKICELRDKMNFRKAKNKWGREEIKSIFEENPSHFAAELETNPELLHNKSSVCSSWLDKKQGNSKIARNIVQN